MILERGEASLGVERHRFPVDRMAWWDGQAFGGCTCEVALMDIDDLAGTLSTVTTMLRPGGWFVASVVHPCFPGNDDGQSS